MEKNNIRDVSGPKAISKIVDDTRSNFDAVTQIMEETGERERTAYHGKDPRLVVRGSNRNRVHNRGEQHSDGSPRGSGLSIEMTEAAEG